MLDIDIQNLSKFYTTAIKPSGFLNSIRSLFCFQTKETIAISNLTLTVERGECLGVVGPNGAGKTTLIKLLCGIIPPTKGNIKVMDYVPYQLNDSFKKMIAFVSGQRNQLFFDLTAEDSFALLREIYDIHPKHYKASIQELADLFEAAYLLDRPLRNLSLGERMKMEIIGALLHEPKMLFLDEPTIGLDCISQNKLRNYLKQINDTKHTTIVLTSHDFSDIIDVCNRCVVLNEGIKIFDGNIEWLLKNFNTKKTITVYNRRCYRPKLLPEFCTVIEDNDDKLSFSLPPDKVGQVYNYILTLNSLADITVEDEDIANVIERIYNKKE